MDWLKKANSIIQGEECSREEALQLLQSKDEEILSILHAVYQIRHHYYGIKVKLNMIINAKSGLCPENCGYCSQSAFANTPIEKYSLIDRKTILEGAREAEQRQVGTYCIVMSGRKPSNREVEEVIGAVQEIKELTNLKICACLGLISEEQAKRLKEAGVDRFNHNINTSKDHHSAITTTHSYDDRVQTIEHVKNAGISPCSGVIVGMGETDEDIIDMAFSLKELNADSIPVNFLHAIPGTKLEHMDVLTPIRCLKILACFRLVNPSKEIRISGGREVNLRTLQGMGLFVANSIFLGDYLTTGGQDIQKDYQMIQDLGFEIETNAFETQSEDFRS